MSRRFYFYVCMFFYIYTVECMYICLNVFMYLCIYMFAIRRERERGRYVPGGQFNCLEEYCYLSPRSNNIISCKQILTFSADKLCPLNIGKQNITTEDDNNFLIFWACFLKIWIFYTLLAAILKTIKIFYRKEIEFMLFVFESLARKW